MEPTTHPASTTAWPKWLLAADAGMQASLYKMTSSHERLRKAVKDGYAHEEVYNNQINFVLDELIARQFIEPKTGRILKETNLPPEVIKATLYVRYGSARRMLRLTCVTKQMALVQLLDVTISSLAEGRLFVALLCLRSIIEHVAHFNDLLAQIQSYSVGSVGFDEINKKLSEITDKLVKSTYSTRVDWMSLGEGKRKEKEIEYKAKESRADLEARRIGKAVNRLGNRVKDIRTFYDILCEFAHPNVGVHFALTRSAKPIRDKEGVYWVRKEFASDAPTGFEEPIKRLVPDIFFKLAECLGLFETLLVEAETEREKVLKIAQTGLREYLKTKRDLLNAYAPCPCGSDLKVRFCCGSRRR
jgi:hypothetical protein